MLVCVRVLLCSEGWPTHLLVGALSKRAQSNGHMLKNLFLAGHSRVVVWVFWEGAPIDVARTSLSEHSLSARKTIATGMKNSFFDIVTRIRADPVESRCSATVSEHWSVLAQRITVAYLGG